jgi:hypothetical protein
VQNLNTKLRLKPSSTHQQLGCRSMVKEAPSKYCFLFRGRGSQFLLLLLFVKASFILQSFDI